MLSAQKKRLRLRQIEVLIVDPDPRIARLVRYVLENFGFKQIHMARNGEEAIDVLYHKPIDLVITEWPMEPMNGINLVSYVRNADNMANRDIPIIMLTGRAEHRDVETARDSGVTEFVVKPFNARTLSNRIVQVIDNPRAFIISRDFVGPDRRRRPNPDASNDQRMSPDEMQKHATRHGDKTVYRIHDQEVVVQKADRTLKQMIGADLTAEVLFDENLLREAQEVIFNMKGDFVNWVTIDINRLEHAYSQLLKEHHDSNALKEVVEVAMTIKAQAGTFGYDFATSVGKLLHDFAETLEHVDEAALTIIRKHIDTLYVIFSKEIQGQGAALSSQILDGLQLLISRYSK